MNPKGTVWDESSFFDEMYTNYINALELITTTNMLESFTSYGFTASIRLIFRHTVLSTPQKVIFVGYGPKNVFGVTVDIVTGYGTNDR